jgi:hypothetical protein
MDFAATHLTSFLKTAASFCDSIDPILAGHFRKTLFDQIPEKCFSNLKNDGSSAEIRVQNKPHHRKGNKNLKTKTMKERRVRKRFDKEKLKVKGLNSEIVLVRKVRAESVKEKLHGCLDGKVDRKMVKTAQMGKTGQMGKPSSNKPSQNSNSKPQNSLKKRVKPLKNKSTPEPAKKPGNMLSHFLTSL